ncbi:hypothetical protein PTKIN_Ptkin01aG0293300 [Pterospermum kingtungense]
MMSSSKTWMEKHGKFISILQGPEISLRVTIFRGTVDANDDLTADEINIAPLALANALVGSFAGKFKQVMQNETAGRVISRLSSKGAAKALEKASKFRSNHPVFKVVIKAGFLQDGYPIVPESFCKGYIKCIPQDVTLKVKEKSWPIRIRLSNRFERAAKFGAGWRAFAAENKLQVGNVCVFEMIKRKYCVRSLHFQRWAKPSLLHFSKFIWNLNSVGKYFGLKVFVQSL